MSFVEVALLLNKVHVLSLKKRKQVNLKKERETFSVTNQTKL